MSTCTDLGAMFLIVCVVMLTGVIGLFIWEGCELSRAKRHLKMCRELENAMRESLKEIRRLENA